VPTGQLTRRGILAIACLVAFASGFIPHAANAAFDENARALELLNAQSCAARAAGVTRLDQQTPQATPTPLSVGGATPVPQPTSAFPGAPSGPAQLYSTPRPSGTAVSPPPVPTPTPNPNATGQPVFITRGGVTPPPITPAGQAPPSPTPMPTGVPTLAPGYIAVISDSFDGNSQQGKPGDAIGNVHILYQDEELVGERAHFDGLRTLTVTGHPYIINHTRDSILNADTIVFDTIDQTAKLNSSSGESAEGVDRGLVHFTSKELYTDPNGVGHGSQANVTTCENPRGGYHVTGKTIDYYPGDKIVISKAILWLGAAAVFFLPRVVIPLRQVVDETRRPSFFPEIGYDQYQGAYIKAKIGFGKDNYYYGYYRIEYFTKVGLGLGYVGFFAKKNGRRQASIDYYRIHDRRTQTSTHNLTFLEQENFSQALRATIQFGYQSNFGPLTSLPPNTSFNGSVIHTGARSSQNYQFSRSAVGSQSSSNSFSFTDTRQITVKLTQAETFQLLRSSTNYGGSASSNASAHFNSLTHLTTAAADYTLTFDKTFSQMPFSYDKLPELQIRPYAFLKHFLVPIQPTFTIGSYSEPSNKFHTTRADLLFVLGPELMKVFGSDFTANLTVHQDAYGTGDLKASILQTMSLSTPIGNHIVNSLSYNESNFNGPAFVPFQFLDQQPSLGNKNAQDLLRFFNGDIYTLTLGFSTNFNRMAQPVSYQISARPSTRSVVLIGGSFSPGSGLGFATTNVQFATPFGRGTTLQFVGDIDWKDKARIINKNIFLSKIIGDCYELRVQYNQASRSVNVTVDILAFPSRSASFGIGQNGPIIPTTFNFSNP
jgi:hypothetical protein